MREVVRYSNVLTLRCQPEVVALVDRAARARGSKPSEYVRQALRTALQLDGFGLAQADVAEPSGASEPSQSQREAVS